MNNAHVPKPLPEIEQELPQCFEESPTQLCEPELESPERIKRRRMEILKNWDANIKFHDRGCVVAIGCKSFVFESVTAAMDVLEQYIENPEKVMKAYGFADYL